MIRAPGPNRWFHRGDVERDIPGREDPEHLKEACWHTLTDLTKQHSRQRPHSGDRATSYILAARVRQASEVGHLAESDLRNMVVTQQLQINGLQDAINRLLAFVPTRAAPLDAEQLHELRRHVEGHARDLFATDVAVEISEVDDDDSSACHRLTVEVPVGESFDVIAFAEAVLALHTRVAEYLSIEQQQALQLVVQPGSSL